MALAGTRRRLTGRSSANGPRRMPESKQAVVRAPPDLANCSSKAGCSQTINVPGRRELQLLGGQLNREWRKLGLLESNDKLITAAEMGEGQFLKDEIHKMEVHYVGRSIQTKGIFLLNSAVGRRV